jgi:hypothetical protein
MFAFGMQLLDDMVDVVPSRADGADVNDFGVVFVGHAGDHDGLVLDIHSDIERNSLGRG